MNPKEVQGNQKQRNKNKGCFPAKISYLEKLYNISNELFKIKKDWCEWTMVWLMLFRFNKTQSVSNLNGETKYS